MSSLFINSYFDNPQSGYGKIAHKLKELLWEDYDLHESSPNVLNFCQPSDYIFRDGFTVGYTPWESDKIPERWAEPLSKVDSFWTTASWLKDVFSQYVNKVEVVPHGIEPEWVPFRRHSNDRPFTFIHVGEPAVRKGGDILLEAWEKYFQHQKNVRLVVKAMGEVFSRKNVHGFNKSFRDYSNVTVITKRMNQAEMWREYALADAMIYPTRGEGFGLIPLEAMATGLPVLGPKERIGDPVLEYIEPIYKLKYIESDYQTIHPGTWLDYDIDEVISTMEWAVNDPDDLHYDSYHNALEIHKKFGWPSVQTVILEKLRALEP